MKYFYLLFSIMIFSISALSQTSIYGKVTDKSTGEELIYANIVLSKNGVYAFGASSDFEGNYFIPVDPGTYEVNVSYTGFLDISITDVVVKAGLGTKLDIQISAGINNDSVAVIVYNAPVPEKGHSHNCVPNSEQLENLPSENIKASVAQTQGLLQVNKNDAVTIGPGRAPPTNYYIDGIRVSESGSLVPQEEIDTLQKDFLGGTPATAGDSNTEENN